MCNHRCVHLHRGTLDGKLASRVLPQTKQGCWWCFIRAVQLSDLFIFVHGQHPIVDIVSSKMQFRLFVSFGAPMLRCAVRQGTQKRAVAILEYSFVDLTPEADFACSVQRFCIAVPCPCFLKMATAHAFQR